MTTEADPLRDKTGSAAEQANELALHMKRVLRAPRTRVDGDLFYLSGEFREVNSPARLAYTFRWDPLDPDDRETVVTLALKDLGEATESWSLLKAPLPRKNGVRFTSKVGETASIGWRSSSPRPRETQGGAGAVQHRRAPASILSQEKHRCKRRVSGRQP